MKKVLFTLLILFIPLFAFADEGIWDSLDTTDYTHTTQNLKHFSEKEYQQAIDSYKNKFQKPKKVKSKNIKTPTSGYSDEISNPEYQVLEEVIHHKGAIMIPTVCFTESGDEILPGYYSLEYYTDKFDKEWLILTQGSKQIAKVATVKSDYAADEDTINYAYATGKGNIVKLLYGNIDVAVEAILYVAD